MEAEGPELDMGMLRAFYQVARLRSFSRAADVLHRSQPAVSRQVQALEAALDLSLLATRRPQVTLNDAGRALYGYAERVLRLCGEAVQAMDELRTLAHGRVVLAASTTPGGYILPVMLARFARLHPGIEVALAVAPSTEVARRVGVGDADLGVLSAAVAGADFFVQPFMRDELVLVAAPSHPLAGRRAAAADLAAQTLLLREEGSGSRAAVEAYLQESGLTFARHLSVGCSEGIKRAAAAGLGLAFLPRAVVGQELLRGELTVVRGWQVARTLHLVVPRDARISPAVAALRAFLQQCAAASPDADTPDA